ncbi:hypothetical protein GCM10009647_073850 [Streptomyces sanglieri]|uniref:hypothetical protein n=1 Tax=Streptomyces sp. Wh19 TaxID=3076629 RepID=UPI0029589FCD|nr:hypothetical protein [Streptomyces sp. Wh19]MDV9198527.1 hypothetical protein [Streptomyces sp. Wh19]
MRAKRIIAVVVTPLAAALAFSPALMTQAMANTTQTSAVSAPQVKTPEKQGTTDGKKAGKVDGENCDFKASFNPLGKKALYTSAEFSQYKSSYNSAYNNAYNTNFDGDACED